MLRNPLRFRDNCKTCGNRATFDSDGGMVWCETCERRLENQPERNSLGTCKICRRLRYRADGIICADCEQGDPAADLEAMGYFEERDSTSPEFDPNNPHDVEAANLDPNEDVWKGYRGPSAIHPSEKI